MIVACESKKSAKSNKAPARPITAIDLFSGAGGLTVGLKKAGIKVLAAVEIDSEIVKTYRANHPEVCLLTNDIKTITGGGLLKQVKSSIDIVAGCPPCQGFSKLTDKYHRSDRRNRLVYEMARMVEELRPRICMMENVSGLAGRGLPLLKRFETRLRNMGYIISRGVLQMADYGVPQSRKRLVLLAGLGFKIPLPAPTHAHSPDKKSNLKKWKTVRQAISNHATPTKLSKALLEGGPKKRNWNIVRDISKLNIDRLKSLPVGSNRFGIPKRLQPDCHKNSRGFSNVYGRMKWDAASPTITGGCLTLSSGRFGHPEKNRTISVREAATLQTFPKTYRFETNTVKKVCQMVGNALPCEFAKIVATSCVKALSSENI